MSILRSTGLWASPFLLLAACVSPTSAAWSAYGAGDYQVALQGWSTEANAGDAKAQYLVGLMYDEGQGVPEDRVEAARWYRLSADQGNAAAQSNLGLLYFRGHGVERSKDEAARWFGRAAAQGFAPAVSNLALMGIQEPAEASADTPKIRKEATSPGDTVSLNVLAAIHLQG
ncbi:MAG: tetratricopeptide repeat protein, partial [Planctomycetota bacterium]|nr:tetratricopeptide repeat protein [Planctomycetota bacterium]